MIQVEESFWENGALISIDRNSILLGYGTCIEKKSHSYLDPNLPQFYFPHFFVQGTPWIQYKKWQEVSLDTWYKQFMQVSYLERLEWKIGHEDIFRNAFVDLQREFQQQKLMKAVPYTFTYHFKSMSKARLKSCMKKALEYLQDYHGYLYGQWNKQQGFIGVTPELLFSYDSHRSHELHTMALAGTKAANISSQALYNDPKEAAEHSLVIEGIKRSLESFGEIKIGNKQILHLKSLDHLMTPIEVNLKVPFEFEKMAYALHPTPALGAYPKIEGIKWLEHYQRQLDRKQFGAPVGLIYPQKGLQNCLVGIRQIQWDANSMRIGAGCGVIQASQFEKEWQEIQLKLHSTRELLGL